MRTLCDVCESAAAILFCAADEAALCRSCDDKVHSDNKLASRHVRVVLASPIDVPRCVICENSPAFFYCETDGISLCLQCDTIVHVGGKRTHGRYLLLRQIVEFPGDNKAAMAGESAKIDDKKENSLMEKPNPASPAANTEAEDPNSGMIDLNTRPNRQAANSHAE